MWTGSWCGLFNGFLCLARHAALHALPQLGFDAAHRNDTELESVSQTAPKPFWTTVAATSACRSRVTLNASDNGQAHSQTHLHRISRSRLSFYAEASSARQGHRKGGLLSCISQSVAFQANCQDAFVHSAQIVRLSTCSQLIRLDLSQNDLTSLEGVSQNTTLKWLSAQSNQIASLTGTASLVQLQVYLHCVLLAVQLVIVCCVYSKAYCKQQIHMVKNQAVLLQA